MPRAPFRADHVGSLLRPNEVVEARARHVRGELSDRELAAVEDRAIEALIDTQQSLGLRSVTDGELRRENWSLDFISGLEGTRVVLREIPATLRGGTQHPARTMKVTTVVGKIRFNGHRLIEHFRFLGAHVRGATAKTTIPSPTMLISASRDWRESVDRTVYPDVQELYHDLGTAYAAAIRAFYDAGCRYLQLDDVNLAYLCDAAMRDAIKARGDDPQALLDTWIRTLNTAMVGRPPDLALTTHICRGNFRSTWFAQGGYEAIAEAIFNRLDYDGYFLEYDSERAGGFEPLRFVPKGNKRIVLGLVTTKTGSLEDKVAIRRRIDAASRYVSMDQLCLSPQCGFASTHEGNDLTDGQQWAKLGQIVELARDAWRDA
ncbi:MAG TPA: 5-methyltetrahydropteroyltriglutamate--homocysteine S-methyltransferase [Steroidobacteraceae bacterium]|nr:5-methyltetrahydropteroyltriglutamate--homocysteine S-methyltransferase [Steroidobacteraceae bacterium]